MDIVSGENSGFLYNFLVMIFGFRYCLFFFLLLYCILIFLALLLFFVLFHTLFLLEGGNERGLRDNDIKFVESFSFFSGGFLNHVGVTNLGFLEFP